MAKLRRIQHPQPVDDLEDALRARARKLVQRGETRKAIVLLREACMRNEETAKLWTSYAALLGSAGRIDDARQAFWHAIWLRRTAGDELRARSTQALLDRLDASVAA